MSRCRTRPLSTFALAMAILVCVAVPLARAQDTPARSIGAPGVDPASPSGVLTPTTPVTPTVTQAEIEASADIVTRTLDNGLRIIVWPDHDIPNVALYTFFRVGSRNEQVGRTGLAHFFEHMMFNGSRNFPPGEFDAQMEASGGSNNAYTSEDVTVYQDWVPRAALDLTFRMESDRMGALVLDEDKIASERDVVSSERAASVDDDAIGYLWEQTNATAFLAHPYQNPIIGWPSDISSWTAEDVQDFFRTYYAPNNATLVAVGDVTPDEVFSLADTYYAPIPRQPAPLDVRTVEPEQTGERVFTVGRVAQSPQLLLAYHSGKPTDPDWPATELLTTILADGASSRLYRRLVEQDALVVDVGVYLDSGFDPKLTWIYATLPEGGDTTVVQNVIDEEIARVVRDGPTPAELAKVQRIKIAGFWRDMQTISGKAEVLGGYQVFHGDYRLLFGAPARYEAVTLEQIRAVAEKVLRSTNRTVGVLEPLAEDVADGEGADGDEEVTP